MVPVQTATKPETEQHTELNIPIAEEPPVPAPEPDVTQELKKAERTPRSSKHRDEQPPKHCIIGKQRLRFHAAHQSDRETVENRFASLPKDVDLREPFEHDSRSPRSNDEQVGQRGVWIMGIAAPPQVRRVVDYSVEQGIRRFAAFAPRTSYGQQMVQTLESEAVQRGGSVAAVELFDGAELFPAARRLADAVKGEGKVAVLVPVAPPGLSRALAALAAAGIDNNNAQLIGTGVWDVPNIGSEMLARGAWYAAPDPARRADFERRFLATYGRPPHRLATLAYDGVSLAAQLARLKPGGDFSAEAITNPNGWSGVDGIFRFLPNGRSQRALAVIAVQAGPGAVVSPAPSSFATPVN